jgi:prepilin-type N-terminal cleavage/methylation domain-containing protein
MVFKICLSRRAAFGLLEIMAVLAIVAFLSSIAVASYRESVIKSNIASLIQLVTVAKADVEYAHNQGTVFGTSGNQTYVASTDVGKPLGLESVVRVSYGCIDVTVSMADLNLDTSKDIVITICPNTNEENYIEWRCGYGATTDADYVKYLPNDCQNTVASIRDTSF